MIGARIITVGANKSGEIGCWRGTIKGSADHGNLERKNSNRDRDTTIQARVV
jgi:hypothetical protein